MGSGASIENASKLPDEELIKYASQLYLKSPEKFEFIFNEAKKTSSIGSNNVKSEAAVTANDPFEKQILYALNLARKEPQKLASMIESSFLPTFEDDFIYLQKMPNGDTQRIQTSEGQAAVLEAINYLRNVTPVSPLVWSDLVTKAAADHAADIGNNGSTSHVVLILLIHMGCGIAIP